MLSHASKAVLSDLARKKGVQPEPRDAAQALEMARLMTGAMADYSGTPPADVTSETVTVPGPAGALAVRLLRPQTERRTHLLVWYHGGGAMAGSLDSHDTALRQLARDTGRTIASVDYRLAPEAVSPAPQEDCIAATRALMKKAAELGCSPDGIAIGGDSIGGLLAAVTALALRDAGDPMPAALVMLYPNTDLRPDRPFASLEEESGNVMTVESLAYENALFVPDPAARTAPEVSPLLAPDLTGLPPTLLVTCEHDPLRDEGEAFADRLAKAGVPVDQHRMAGTIHAVLQMDAWLPEASKVRARVARFLRD